MYQIVIANEAADLAQPFADFVKHDRRLDARENLTAVNFCQASPAARQTTYRDRCENMIIPLPRGIGVSNISSNKKRNQDESERQSTYHGNQAPLIRL
jgi:hypothetical protein